MQNDYQAPASEQYASGAWPAYTPTGEYPAIYEEHQRGWLARLTWMIVGFNVGFILPTVLIFIVLPLIAPDIAPRRAEGNPFEVASNDPGAIVVITSTPLPSLTPTETLPATATEPPTLEPTQAPTEEAVVAAAATETDTPPTDIPPTETPWPTSTPIPPTATPMPAPPVYTLDTSNITFQRQTWNNCGPANLAMGLSYYNWEGDQADTATYLKPDREDKNVSPEQMISYVNNNTNLRAVYRVAGTRDILRWLVSNEFVVIIESGYQPAGEDWYGHYRLVVGYNDARSEFQFYDSYLGRERTPMVTQSYRDFEADWQAFNYTYLVIYPPEREAELSAFLGRDWSITANWRAAADMARAEANAAPDNAYAFFNLGTALTMLGDYQTAGRAFDQAFNLGLPWRMLWYQFMPYEAYFQSSRLDDVVSLAQATINTTPYVEESYYYLGRVYEVWGNTEEAITQYRTALRYNINFRPAQEALTRLGAL